MSEALSAACEQADCPIATEGRCLEGFASGVGCPHLRTEGEAGPESVSEATDVTEADAEEDTAEEPSEPWISLGGGECLTTTEAHEIAAEYGAEVILLAGEFKSGKTTLLVEMYGRFLHGPVEGWSFGGSKTLVALDKRHFPTRYASGNASATTERTQPEHEGLIHLRLVKDGRTVPLFFTDLRGERFEHVRDGVAANGEVPLVGRADRTLILLDGERIGDLASRQLAIHQARQLIGGLTEPGGLVAGRPMAIVLTKRDLVDAKQRSWLDAQAAALAEFAAQRGAVASVMTIAARPDAAPDEPEGLEDVVAWLTEQMPRPVEVSDSVTRSADRMFWRLSVADRS